MITGITIKKSTLVILLTFIPNEIIARRSQLIPAAKICHIPPTFQRVAEGLIIVLKPHTDLEKQMNETINICQRENIQNKYAYFTT